jgi:hypothetical protein
MAPPCKGKNGHWAPARAAQEKRRWGSIGPDGFPARLGAHWEADCRRPSDCFPPSLSSTAMSILCVACWRSARGMIEWLSTRKIWRCTRGRFTPHRLCVEPLLNIAPYWSLQFESVQNAASFFASFFMHIVSVRFSCGG